MARFSKNSIRTRKGWCTRKGHIWPPKWKAEDIFGKIFHFKYCKRCREQNCLEPGLIGYLITMTIRKRSKQLKAAISDRNPILEALKGWDA